MHNNTQYTQAEDALKKAAEAAEKIDNSERRAEIFTQIGHGFIRLGTENFLPGRRQGDSDSGFQPRETSR